MKLLGGLAKRFLLSKSSDGFLSLISFVSVMGVALGVAALTTVTSVINGFEDELASVITDLNGDVILYSPGTPVGDKSRIERKLSEVLPEVASVAPSFVAELMISGNEGVAGAVLEGFEPERFSEVTEIPSKVVEGRFPKPDPIKNEIALGKSLADKIGASVGDTVRLIVPFLGAASFDEDPENFKGSLGAPRVITATVSGLIQIGMHKYDSKFAFAPISSVQRFLNQPDRFTSFKLKLAPHADSFEAVAHLRENFGYPFRAKNWAQLNRVLFEAIQLEKAVIAVILTAIIIVAAFNVVSTLMMMIHDKTKEIAILKAMGLRPSQSFGLFCAIGLGIGLCGIFLGLLGGLGLNTALEQTQWVHIPAEIYNIDHLPVVVRWAELFWIGVFALLISFFATLYPAYRISVKSPLDGLRYE